MKVTQQDLKQIIAEEVQKALKEGGGGPVKPAPGAGVRGPAKPAPGIQWQAATRGAVQPRTHKAKEKANIVKLVRAGVSRPLSAEDFAEIVRQISAL